MSSGCVEKSWLGEAGHPPSRWMVYVLTSCVSCIDRRVSSTGGSWIIVGKSADGMLLALPLFAGFSVGVWVWVFVVCCLGFGCFIHLARQKKSSERTPLISHEISRVLTSQNGHHHQPQHNTNPYHTKPHQETGIHQSLISSCLIGTVSAQSAISI